MSEDKRDAIQKAQRGIVELQLCKTRLTKCKGEELTMMIGLMGPDRSIENLLRRTLAQYFEKGGPEWKRYIEAADYYFTPINLSNRQKFAAVRANIATAQGLLDEAIVSLERRIERLKAPSAPLVVSPPTSRSPSAPFGSGRSTVSLTEPFFADCPTCSGSRHTELLANHREAGSDENTSWSVEYRIIRCKGCGHIQFQTSSKHSEDIECGYDGEGKEYWEPVDRLEHFPPLPARPRPVWTTGHPTYSETLLHLLDEAYSALDNGMPVLAAIAVRTAFDASTEILQIPTRLTFQEKLDELLACHHITPSQRQTLDVLTNAGNAAAHRGWQPSYEELDTMFSIFEHYVHHTFVNSHEQADLARHATELAEKTPLKQNRKRR
jgi:hypothetical protein